MDSKLEPVKNKILPQIISHLLAGITGVIGVLNWFKLRETQKLIVAHSGINIWSWKAIDNFTFLGFGIIWLCVVLFSQYYYEIGYKKNKIWKKFSFITGVQLLLLFITYIIGTLYGIEKTNTLTVVYIAALCIIGLGLIVFSFCTSARN